MKIQQINQFTNSQSLNNKNVQHPSFKAYKHLGNMILGSGGLAVAYLAKAFHDAPEADILEVSTVDGDKQASKDAYDRLKQFIEITKNDASVKQTERLRFTVEYDTQNLKTKDDIRWEEERKRAEEERIRTEKREREWLEHLRHQFIMDW